MEYITRSIEKSVKERLFRGKVVIIYGARQVGKTTLSKRILADFGEKGSYLNCENFSVQRGLAELEAERIKSFLGNYKIIVLDEAQVIPDIGKALKLIVDTYPEMQIIATGSSSFGLAQKAAEPLTGRNFQFTLYPFLLEEIKGEKGLSFLDPKLEQLLRFGNYPGVLGLSEKEAKERLSEIASNYLLKDVLQVDGIKKSSMIRDLLRLIALQIGREVSYNELAAQLNMNRLTVQKYLDILEQSFIIFRLNAYSKNKRKEISKSIKIYFWDLGIRNTLIENWNALDIRDDAGFLWENFCIAERKKFNETNFRFASLYFWRTYDQQEIDLIEERDGKISAFECKSKTENAKIPKYFSEKYPEVIFETINWKNYGKFFIK